MLIPNSSAEAEIRRRALEDELVALLRLPEADAGELLLVRHAEPARSPGPDPMLSCHGLDQAERFALRLADTCVDAVYCSPERRTQQTARIVAGARRAVHVLDGIADIEFDEPRQHAGGTPLSSAVRFLEMPRWDSLPGFECSRSFRRRAVQTTERVLAIHPGNQVVVVTHGSVINAYLSMLLSVPADMFFTPDHASISTVRWRDGRYAVRTLNDLSHLCSAVGFSARSELFTLR